MDSGANFRKSSFSDGTSGNCVEVAALPGAYAVRDSRDPDSPVLVYSDAEWRAFIAGVKAGEFD